MFHELHNNSIVDHDTSDDGSGRVEVEDFLQWVGFENKDQQKDKTKNKKKNKKKKKNMNKKNSLSSFIHSSDFPGVEKKRRRSLDLNRIQKELLKLKMKEERTEKKKIMKKRRSQQKMRLRLKQKNAILNLFSPRTLRKMKQDNESDPDADPSVIINNPNSKVRIAFEDVVQTVILSLEVPGSSLSTTFETFDMDGNDGLSMLEFDGLLSLLEIGSGVDGELSLTKEEKHDLFDMFDHDHDGEISLDDFERILLPAMKKELGVQLKL